MRLSRAPGRLRVRSDGRARRRRKPVPRVPHCAGHARRGRTVAHRVDRAAGAGARNRASRICGRPGPIPASSSSRAAPPACPSSFRARTTTTPTTPRPPRRCAGSPAIPYCCWCCRSRTTCRSPVRAFRASSSTAAAVVLSQSTRPEEVFRLVARHRVTHIKVVPALLIRLINSPKRSRNSTPPRSATSRAAASACSRRCASAPRS